MVPMCGVRHAARDPPLLWQAAGVTSLPPDPTGTPDLAAGSDLEELVDVWLTVPDISEMLKINVLKVRQLFNDGVLVAIRRGERNVLSVPAGFLDVDKVVKHLTGTITVLRDNGFSDIEVVRWLHTPDDSLPGTPVQALQENRGSEVKRRAQATAW